MKLWVYRDFSGWHSQLAPAATRRGHDVTIFSDHREPTAGVVFGRMHHDPSVRLRDKAVWAHLATNPDLLLIPGYRASVLYDDKAEQARQLSRWLPRTVIARCEEEAEEALDLLGIPLMSKSADGAGSYNVRIIRSRDDAMMEARRCFGSGLPIHRGQVQRGYVLWQRFMAGNAYDFRVIAVGGERLILRRGNRPDRPMASGSGKERPIGWPDAEASEVLDFANAFFAAEDQRFSGIDIVRDHEAGRWVILECTVGWPLGKNHMHKTVSGRPWSEFFDIILDQIEAGAFA